MKKDSFKNFMSLALKEAEKAFHKNEIPVGAILVDRINGKIVSKAHNITKSGYGSIDHSEIIAIRKFYNKYQNIKYLTEYDMYITMEPCPMCLHAILLSRIKNVYIGTRNTKYIDYYEKNAEWIKLCNPNANFYYGIMEENCEEIIKKFFCLKRKDIG
jgi:tRNA(adenine34) deaminase